MAIMGPSGAGKSSLLDVLAGRIGDKSHVSGFLSANGNELTRTGDFAEFGAYVQQDDVLLDVITVREHLEFAAAMRNNDEDDIDKVVANLIDRLGLTHCADTYFGRPELPGLSGGEKKRCCIGYELIGNPSCLLLDEPTSGLDSQTALRIARLLRQEA